MVRSALSVMGKGGHVAERGRAERRIRGRGLTAAIAAATAVGALLATSGAAHAQSDIAPPLPNVLILLDTSGSMERLPDGTVPAISSGGTSTTIKNRWVSALEVLGGSISNYKLLGIDRSSLDFKNEYSLAGQAPTDYEYYLNHFRPLSNDCTIGPTAGKTWPTNWLSWGPGDFGWRTLSGGALAPTMGPSGTCGPTVFRTDGLGVLDAFRDQARFGLMTFDTSPDPRTGWNGFVQLPADGIAGQWSYFPGWDLPATSSPAFGWPAACKVDVGTWSTHGFEVGARNPSAPPWEGPLVPFAKDDSTMSLRTVNDRIRYAILAARPYGATPVGPMFADAQYYYWNDPNGPKADPFTSCRGNFIILITDGFPNQDLRPYCENNADPKAASVWPSCNITTGGGGCCPAKRAQDTAYDLAHPPAGKPAVKTFVVGFGLSDDAGKPVDCSTVDPSTGICSTMPTTDVRYPCCTLHQIAYNGGTDKAYIASSPDVLRSSIVKAMSDATAATTTSRTVPVFAAASSGSSTGTNQYQFLASFKVSPFQAWSGNLKRVRYECASQSGVYQAVQRDVDPAQGDDFALNLNQSLTRSYYSWNGLTKIPRKKGRPRILGYTGDSRDSIRPAVSSTSPADGVSSEAGRPITGTGSTFVSSPNAPPEVMNITATTCADTGGNADLCKQKYLNYAVAQPQPNTSWASRVGNAMADMFHATPVPVSQPSAFMQDESYAKFRGGVAGSRAPMLLAATNDGLLHAFQTNVTAQTQNELWAFIPPAVLPDIPRIYGGAHALLLDNAPVVRDVAFGAAPNGATFAPLLTGATPPWGRTRAQARSGTAAWRTVAVGGLTSGGGYYAVDVTEPKNPIFLWQLTTVGDAPLFGTLPASPAIGTVFYRDPSQNEPVETPVAILPGGDGTVWKSGACTRWIRPEVTTDPYLTARPSVRCWTGSGLSLTVVRLYDGMILRRFSNDPAGDGTPSHPPEASSPVTDLNPAVVKAAPGVSPTTTNGYAGIDSPITGAVALYPGNVGTVTTRAFVGDSDGALWKADFTDTEPQKWTFSLFHDAYIAPDNSPVAGQPIAVAPLLSLDRAGNIVVNYATGDQNNFVASSVNHVYSLTERVTKLATTTVATPSLNWHLRLVDGVTPTGPMTLFNSNLFFSTFTPGVSSSSACLKGQGTIWGVDYIETEPGTTGTATPALPRARIQRQPTESAALYDATCPSLFSPQIPNADRRPGFSGQYRCLPLAPGSIVFGLGLTQRPSCVTSSSSVSSDPYTGMSMAHQTVSSVSTGEFQLVVQTGPKAGAAGGPGPGTIADVPSFVRRLPAPVPVTRIESWASVIE